MGETKSNAESEEIWRRKEFFKKVIKTAEALLKNNDINKEEFSPIKYVVLHFHVKAIKLAQGILVLYNAGLMSDVQILFRPLFETFYYCEYLLIDPRDTEAVEKIMALAAFEDKNTEEGKNKYGGVDIDKMATNEKDKVFLRKRVPQKAQIVRDNYSFIAERLRKLSTEYTNLPEDEILNKEGIRNKFFLEEVNKKYNKETNTENFWKKYKNVVIRDCSKAIHALDFNTNVVIKNENLEYKLKDREGVGKVILSPATNFLIRIMDVTNEIFDFKANDEIKKLFNEAKGLS